MKTKMNGKKIYRKICILSIAGIIGIVAWCTISLDMGNKGMTSNLLFAVFLLILVACFSALASSEENLKEKFEDSREELLKYNRRKIIIFIIISGISCWLFNILFSFKSLMTGFFMTMGICYPVLCIGIIVSNRKFNIELQFQVQA